MDTVPRVLVKYRLKFQPFPQSAVKLMGFILASIKHVVGNIHISVHTLSTSVVRICPESWILQELHCSSWFRLFFDVFLLTFLEEMGNLFLITCEQIGAKIMNFSIRWKCVPCGWVFRYPPLHYSWCRNVKFGWSTCMVAKYCSF